MPSVSRHKMPPSPHTPGAETIVEARRGIEPLYPPATARSTGYSVLTALLSAACIAAMAFTASLWPFEADLDSEATLTDTELIDTRFETSPDSTLSVDRGQLYEAHMTP